MTAENQRLLKLIEECSEVQHVACKIIKYGLRWAPGAHYPDKKAALLSEISDLRAAIVAVEADLALVDLDRS